MPRANRTYLPGFVWHITHRCHDRNFLLKATRHKNEWKKWIHESKKRYNLRVLSYTITDNHIHLLVHDKEPGSSISLSMQLAAGNTAQNYNFIHSRRGAFWEDRYHATAVETGQHLLRCISYIDLNMVRAGMVSHPSEWPWGGYQELQGLRSRYRLIDLDDVMGLLGFSTVSELKQAHARMIEMDLQNDGLKRNEAWSDGIAVGDADFIRLVHERLGSRAEKRRIIEDQGLYVLKEPQACRYAGDKEAFDNLFDWATGDGPC